MVEGCLDEVGLEREVVNDDNIRVQYVDTWTRVWGRRYCYYYSVLCLVAKGEGTMEELVAFCPGLEA